MVRVVQVGLRSFLASSCLLVGCVPANPVNAGVPRQSAVSVQEFEEAMEATLPREVNGRTVLLGHCVRVTRLQCSPRGNGARLQCRYRSYHGPSGTAVIERQEGTFWRWVSGPTRCSMTF